MSYATVDNIKSMFRDFSDNADAAVTDAEIQEFLDDADAIIDAKIGTLYTLPITIGDNPKSWAILRRLESFKVAAIVDDILNSYGEADKKPMWGKRAHELMLELVPPIDKKTCKQCEPTMKLLDATYLGTNMQKSKIKLSQTTEPIFQKGVDKW